MLSLLLSFSHVPLVGGVDILLPFLSTGESIMNDDEKEINNDNEETNDQVPSTSVSRWGRFQKLAVLLYRVSDE